MENLRLSFTTFFESQEYPAVRVGGIYAILLGILVMVVARFDMGELDLPILLGATFLLSVAVLFNRPLRKYLAFGRLPTTQKQMTKVVFAFECLLVSAVLVLFSTADPHLLVTIMLLIIAAGELTLTYVYGPWMLLLGAFGIVNAVAALWLRDVPFPIVVVLDGIPKLGFGFLMLISSW